MNGMKLITFGFLLTFLGIGILAVLAIPNASLALASVFTTSSTGQSFAPVTSLSQTFGMLDPAYVIAAQTFQRVGEIIAFVFLLAGLTVAGYGTFRKA